MTKRTKPERRQRTEDESTEAEHGIAGGFYDRGPLGLTPVLKCLCEWETSSGSNDWEEAGRELDEHLEEVGAT